MTPPYHQYEPTFARTQRKLADLLQRPVDLVMPEGLKPLIKEYVLNAAEVIYEDLSDN